MDSTAKRSLEFVLGPLMATVVTAAALVVVAASPLNKFPEIQRAYQIARRHYTTMDRACS
jgi:hypothetical protein